MSFSSIYAQSSRCSTDEFLHSRFEANDAMKLRYEQTIQSIRSLTQNKMSQKVMVDGEDILTIPVVFHIVHRISTQDIDNERIFEQIDVLNKDYSGENTDIGSVPSDFTEFVGASRIRFELASFDPDGIPTDGINRFETDSITFSISDDGIKHSNMGGVDAWNSSEYLNIWVGKIDNNILGYATPPNTASAAEDGVVLGYKYVGLSSNFSYNLGRTATHEVGHYLGLSHIWGPYGPSCVLDDGISDTPMQYDAHYVNPGHPSLSCSSADMFMNYMDYVEDEDMFFFTEGQVANMETALENFRSGLLTSPGLTLEEGINTNDIKVFPVPVQKGGELTISIPDNVRIDQVQLVDVLGRVHLSEALNNEETIHILKVNEMAPGVYMLRLNGQEISYNKQIIIR